MTDIRRASDADADAVADVYISSFRHALPSVNRPHTDDEIRRFVSERLVPEYETWVADENGLIVAMMALSPGWVDQLYVAPHRLGEGLGTTLLDLAKERSDGSLQLWTFQLNERARRFYERNGFVAAEFTDGAANEEREPDVRYVWRREA